MNGQPKKETSPSETGANPQTKGDQPGPQDSIPAAEKTGDSLFPNNGGKNRDATTTTDSARPIMLAKATESLQVARNPLDLCADIGNPKMRPAARSGDPVLGWFALAKGVKPKPTSKTRGWR